MCQNQNQFSSSSTNRVKYENFPIKSELSLKISKGNERLVTGLSENAPFTKIQNICKLKNLIRNVTPYGVRFSFLSPCMLLLNEIDISNQIA